MIQRFEHFSYDVFEIVRCWHKLAADEMEVYGLTGAQVVYLNQLYRFSQGIPAAKLAQVCGRDKADASRMIAVLEQKGLAVRKAQGGNGYRAPVCLTEQGRQAAEAIRIRAAVAVENAGKGFSEQEREIFYTVLDTITQNLQNLCKDGLPR